MEVVTSNEAQALRLGSLGIFSDDNLIRSHRTACHSHHRLKRTRIGRGPSLAVRSLAPRSAGFGSCILFDTLAFAIFASRLLRPLPFPRVHFAAGHCKQKRNS